MKKFLITIFFMLLMTYDSNADEIVRAYTTLEPPLAQSLFDEFEKDTGIKVLWERLSGGETIMKLIDESADQKASIWVGGVGTQHIEAKLRALSVPYKSSAAKNIPAHYRDRDNYWTGLYIAPLSFCINKDLSKEFHLRTPRRWDELTLPQYTGQIRAAHPYTSGTGYNMLSTIIRINNGDEDEAFNYFKRLSKSVDEFTRSGTAPSIACASGDIPIAIGYLDTQIRLKRDGANIAIVIPEDGVGFETVSMSILKSTADLTNAYKLYDWILGSKAADLISEWYVIPLSKFAHARETGFSLSNMNLLKQDDQWDADNKIRLLRRWEREISPNPSKE